MPRLGGGRPRPNPSRLHARKRYGDLKRIETRYFEQEGVVGDCHAGCAGRRFAGGRKALGERLEGEMRGSIHRG